MDASADYTAASHALGAALPAYVSYVIESVSGFDALRVHDKTAIVVRTSDGTIVSGTKPKIEVSSGHESEGDVIRHGPFKPACYAAVSATLTSFESHPVEAIALHPLCREKSADDHSDNTDFQTLYVDPDSHLPIAAVGANDDEHVRARLSEHFALAAGHVVPSDFSVKVAGSGMMFWLNVDAHQTYTDYHFKSVP